jgi:hypothetical protein
LANRAEMTPRLHINPNARKFKEKLLRAQKILSHVSTIEIRVSDHIPLKQRTVFNNPLKPEIGQIKRPVPAMHD